MFGLFQKKKPVIAGYTPPITTTLENPKNYPTEVLEIHNEFDIAGDKILKEAYNIIQNTDERIIKKASLLNKFGFNQTPELITAKQLVTKKELSKETIKNIEIYRRQYPNYKFITEEIVRDICHKYNLVFADVSKYKGFVPEKNLSEMEVFYNNFKVDKNTIHCYGASNSSRELPSEFILENAEIIISNRGYRHICIKGNPDLKAFQSDSDNVDYFYSNDGYDIFGMAKYGSVRFFVETNNSPKICAPLKDMDTTGMRLNDYKLEKHYPDPIILQRVKSGYLIITKWGDEANDPELSVESHN